MSPKLQFTPMECHQRLRHLASQSEDLTIEGIISPLCHILMRTDQEKSYVLAEGNHYPTRRCMWTKKLASTILEDLKHILSTLFKLMRENDLKILKFSPTNVEITTKNVIKFTKSVFSKHVSSLMACGVTIPIDDHTTDFSQVLEICNNILGVVAVKVKYEGHPTLANTSSPLWNKLNQERSVSSLLEKNSFPVCPNCFADQLKEHGKFAIIDCCNHLMCAACAKKLYDIRGYLESSRCPACYAPVTAWTDSHHFRQFKSGHLLQTTMWHAARRLKSVLQ